MWYSERKNNIRREIQRESISAALKNQIWSSIYLTYFKEEILGHVDSSSTEEMIQLLYFNFFKTPIDNIRSVSRESAIIKDWLLNKVPAAKWETLLNFIEACHRFHPDDDKNKEFSELINLLFQNEYFGFRLVNGNITEITNELEIKEIEEAINSDDQFGPVGVHLDTALKHLSSKPPDYRNSIKESISAVETICKITTNKPNATLGDALKVIESHTTINPLMKQAFEKLYAYTNDPKEGVRHALIENGNPTFEEAKFMLVCCSAFINYLKANIK